MDRRGFLAGVGSMGAAAASGWAAVESDASAARARILASAAGIAKSAPAGRPRVGSSTEPLSEGLVVGYLFGSPALLDDEANGRVLNATGVMPWSPWSPALSRQTPDQRVSVSIGILQAAPSAVAPQMLKSLEVVAHFALDGTPFVATFPAWKHEAAASGRRANATSPIAFDAAMPDRVALQVDYALGETVPHGISDSGRVYLPLGARDGPGVGLYVLAGPSRYTGMPPDLRGHVFSGDLRSPLARPGGGTPDFDYVALAVRPAAA
jgi:hypothetical protein